MEQERARLISRFGQGNMPVWVSRKRNKIHSIRNQKVGLSNATTVTRSYHVTEGAPCAMNAGVFKVKGHGKQRRNNDGGMALERHSGG